MTKINKLLVSLSPVLTPLIALSCAPNQNRDPVNKPKDEKKTKLDSEQDIISSIKSNTKNKNELTSTEPKKEIKGYEPAKTELQKIYDKLFNKFDNFVKFEQFVPNSIKGYTWIINDELRSEYFNDKFFHLKEKKFPNNFFTKISSKDDFNNSIITRFKELNNIGTIKTQDSEIITTFEKLYLNNQNLNKILESNDIYISNTYEENDLYDLPYFIIPFDKPDGTILVNIVNMILPPRPVTLEYIDPREKKGSWVVFTIPKNKPVKFVYKFDTDSNNSTEYNEKVRIASIEIFKWFNIEFKKYYKD